MDGIDYIAAYKEHGTQNKAAEALGITRKKFRYWHDKQKEAQAFNALGLKMIDAEGAVMDGLDVKGTSRYYKLDDGGIWVKTDKEKQEQLDRFKSIAEAVVDDINPIKPVKRQSTHTKNDLLSCYVLSDYHLGMFSDHDLDGKWNTDMATETLYRWVDYAVENTIDSHTGVFLQLGDFFHANDTKGVTPASGHVLDIDVSWDDVIRIGTQALEYALTRMLERHDHVHFINAEANHDPDAAKWIQVFFERLFRDNPRLSVDCTSGGFYAYQWGDTALYAHHGHARGINDVSKTLTAMYPQIYGNTKHRYAHIGHFHHAKTRPMGDDGLMEVKIHKTLAAKDQYAVTHGYMSQRGAVTEFYHKEHGFVGSLNVTPSMLI